MNYKYEVAISFAGEERSFAEAVAEGLRKHGVAVFYDNYEPEQLWGEDLSVKRHLSRGYFNNKPIPNAIRGKMKITFNAVSIPQ